MQDIHFSVIIPTYNRAKFLTRAIDSIVAQTYTDWELLIVDDGSTDNTKDLVTDYCRADVRIKYIYQQNQRVSEARNNALGQATGNYICFLDSDDEYKNNHLQTFAEVINAGKANNLLYTKFISVENGVEQVFEPDGNTAATDAVGNILQVYLPYSPPVQTICVPAAVAKSVAFNSKYNYTECYDYCAKCAAAIAPFFIDKATVYMHIHDANISVANNNKQALNFYTMQLKEFSEMAQDGFYNVVIKTKEYRFKIESLHLNIIKALFREKKYQVAFGQLMKLISWKPSFLFSKQAPVLMYQLIKQ